MHEAAQDILEFWLKEAGPAGWYKVDDAFDQTIRDRFAGHMQNAAAGGYDAWRVDAQSCLALLILLDQFPRNMFRGDARAFACDAKARAVAQGAIQRGFDRRTPFPERQFFYLPLMHSESVPDQDRAVRLFAINDPDGDNLNHARAHRLVIRRFCRFPYRNDALGRESSPEETAFLKKGGYGAALREVKGG